MQFFELCGPVFFIYPPPPPPYFFIVHILLNFREGDSQRVTEVVVEGDILVVAMVEETGLKYVTTLMIKAKFPRFSEGRGPGDMNPL